MVLTIEKLRASGDRGAVCWSFHASERIQQRGIFREDVISAMKTGSVTEQAPDAYPFPVCLVRGTDTKGSVIHLVCGYHGDAVLIIAAYEPSPERFEDDPITRKGKQ